MKSLLKRIPSVRTWFDTSAMTESQAAETNPNKYILPMPFIILNLGVLAVFWVGWSWVAVATAVVLYAVRMFGITGVYHRYFSHRTYKTSRWFQFVLAFLGNSAAQRGPLWWAAHHRHHHRFSDQAEDPHSPGLRGFWNSHMLWWSRRENVPTKTHLINDFAKYPEIRFLDRWDSLAPITVGAFCWAFGALLHRFAPQLGTTGFQMFIWGFVISTVVLFHGVATINSLAHVFGSRRYKTTDTSRNNPLLAVITLGEGWHNNHHHYQNAARNGFFWWEIDLTYYVIKAFSWAGLVWDLKAVPDRIKYGIAPKTEKEEAAAPIPGEREPMRPASVRGPRVTTLLPGLQATRPVSATAKVR
jgi:stearoyl-CoA desaturase (delta-9 desaturase)